MTPQIKILVLFLFLVLFNHSPSCRVEGFKDGMKVTYPIHEAMIIKLMKTRKLMADYTVMDYDYGGANPKHDPRKGKPGGGGGKNIP